MTALKILRSTLDQIRRHSESTYPEECCGLLVADGGKVVVEALGMRNAFPGPKNDRFHIDPLEFFKADRAVSQKAQSIAGIYHSHPDYPAKLSSFDLEHSFPWYSYIVVSVPKGKADEVKLWVPNEKRTVATEDTLEIVE